MDLEREVSTEEGQKLAEMYGIPFLKVVLKKILVLINLWEKLLKMLLWI